MTSFHDARIHEFVLPKGKFLQPLDGRKLKGRLWEVLEPFTYETDHGLNLYVPRGFISDLGSIPPFLWWILPPDHTYSQACVLHDYLCGEGHMLYSLSVRQVSEIFEQAMRDLGVEGWKRAVMFRSVLWFGPKWKTR